MDIEQIVDGLHNVNYSFGVLGYEFNIASNKMLLFKQTGFPSLDWYHTATYTKYNTTLISNNIEYLTRDKYYLDIDDFPNSSDYIYGFYDFDGCDLLVFSNKNNDYYEHDIYEWQKPCFYHFHKYPNYTVSYQPQSHIQKLREIQRMVVNFNATILSPGNYSDFGGITYFCININYDIFFVLVILVACSFVITCFGCNCNEIRINENVYIDSHKKRWINEKEYEGSKNPKKMIFINKASVLQSTLFKFFRKNEEKDKDTKKGH